MTVLVQDSCRPADPGLSLGPVYRATDESAPTPSVLDSAPLHAATSRIAPGTSIRDQRGGGEAAEHGERDAEEAIEVVLVRNAVVE